jgi:hypothetical protein
VDTNVSEENVSVFRVNVCRVRNRLCYIASCKGSGHWYRRVGERRGSPVPVNGTVNKETALFGATIQGFHEGLLWFQIIILLHVYPLLGNELVNKFPRRHVLGKHSVAALRNNRGGCVFRVAVTSRSGVW